MPDTAPLCVTALAASAQLGGTERVLLDFAARAFEHDLAVRVITPRDGPLLTILNELGIPTEVVPAPEAMLRGSQRVGALATLPAALAGLTVWARRVRAHPLVVSADVVYSVSFKTYLASRGSHQPVVWHLHEFPPALTGAVWTRLAHRMPDRLIANSRAVGNAWSGRKAGKPRGAIVVPNGVDLDRFRPRERSFWIHEQLGLPHNVRLVGMPAVLARWKGQLSVLEAFAPVADRHADAHLVFVGSTIYDTAAERSYESDLGRAVSDVGDSLKSRVHRLPFQAKVELVYPELDVAVHYSTRPEAFGRVILEAMACGVPVLAAAEGGPTEIVTDGGWLVEPRSPSALAHALSAALDLVPEQLQQMGSWGRVRAEDHFSARRFARDVSAVLRGATR